ncbi:unnamed protein product [Protopolystoma xenopodis]|uniref:Uncharacterized protein n=1 Tax=Protopolystoma xenopodis TaxID=117903 RepID=A0A3S5CBB7_9PLAT|nr:unnamed protein product [Protopolystoma xenopodis]
MSILPEDDDRLLLFFTCKQLSVGVAGTLLSYDGRKDQEDKLKYFRIGDFLRFFDLYPNFRSQSRDLHVSLDLPKFLVWEAGLTRLPVVSIEPLYNTLRPLGLLYQAARGRNKGRSSLSNRIRRSAADLATVSLHLLLKSAGLGPLVDWTRRWRNLGIPEVSGAVVWMPGESTL